jgi:endoglucanase
MQWAEAAFSQQPEQPYQVNDSRNLAAVELYALTGDAIWHDLFVATSALINSGTPLYLYENHDQAEAAWAYLQIPVEKSNQGLRENCTQAIFASADFMLNSQAKAGFGWLKYPWSPPFAGAFTLPYARDVIWAWLLRGEERYLGSVEMAMQSVHGVNPLNISYTTGAGNRTVNHIMHPDSRIAGYSAPAGITVLGPLDIAMTGERGDIIVENYGQYCYPNLRKWPVLETFLDVFWIPLMDEFSIKTMATQVYTLGFLAAHHTR